MKTLLDCLESGSRFLEKRGIEDARRNMQWLAAKQLACSRVELYTWFDRPMTEAELAPLRELVKRRSAGEPLQHLLGSVEFCGREFRCDARALIPRPETEEIVTQILALAEASRSKRILDVGTGSGVIGLSLLLEFKDRAPEGEIEVVMSDVSADALALARENAELHGEVPIFMESDLFENIEGVFDLIVANLPYVAEGERGELSREVAFDPPSALFAGPDGLELIRRFIPAAKGHLAPEGLLAMEIGHDQAEAVRGLLVESGYSDIQARRDLSGNSRFVFARASQSR